MELQLVLDTLERIETKLDRKAEQAAHEKLEERVRQNEKDLVKVFTVGSMLSVISGFIGWKV